jgi:hypothetical protein
MTRKEAIRIATAEYQKYSRNPSPEVRAIFRTMSIVEIGGYITRAIYIRAEQIMQEHNK